MKAHPWLLSWRILTVTPFRRLAFYRGWIWRLARSEEVNTFVPFNRGSLIVKGGDFIHVAHSQA
jgi:hypothetical protein